MPSLNLQCSNENCNQHHSDFVFSTNCIQENQQHYFHFTCLVHLIFYKDLIYCPYCCNDLSAWALNNKTAILDSISDRELAEAYLASFATWAILPKPKYARISDLEWIKIRRRYNSP